MIRFNKGIKLEKNKTPDRGRRKGRGRRSEVESEKGFCRGGHWPPEGFRYEFRVNGLALLASTEFLNILLYDLGVIIWKNYQKEKILG